MTLVQQTTLFGRVVMRARAIQRSLGNRVAAGYLRNQEVPFADAYELLIGRAPRF
jgi:hypothetical protein